jgi:hypothetical protein
MQVGDSGNDREAHSFGIAPAAGGADATPAGYRITGGGKYRICPRIGIFNRASRERKKKRLKKGRDITRILKGKVVLSSIKLRTRNVPASSVHPPNGPMGPRAVRREAHAVTSQGKVFVRLLAHKAAGGDLPPAPGSRGTTRRAAYNIVSRPKSSVKRLKKKVLSVPELPIPEVVVPEVQSNVPI